MNKLRVGIVGAGGSVASVHFEAYQSLDLIDVVAAADVNENKLNLAVERWGVHGYTDYTKMLEKESLDIACVCVPARYHREVAEKAAEYKAHVLIEKPIAITLSDGMAIVNKCHAEKVQLYYGSTYRHFSSVIKARNLIKEGYLGDISLLMEIVAGGSGKTRYRDLGEQHYATGGPGGHGLGILDHGVHMVDIFRWFLGSEVESVFGKGNYSGNSPASEHVTMNFKSGAVAHLIANNASYSTALPAEGIFNWGGNWNADGYLETNGGWDSDPICIYVYGDTGALRIFPYAEQLFYFSEKGIKPIQVKANPMPGNFTMQMVSFVNSINNGEEPAVTGLEGIRNLEVVLAAYRSAETNSVVELSNQTA